MKEVRTRFAPSPTGYMHIGNLRTALYEYLISKSLGGKFILRIEDTDQGRFVQGATDVIYDTLKKVGLVHDEGPDIGGNYGPYVQSERKDIYKKYAEELVKSGNAYYCFCSKERLESLHDKKNEDGKSFGGYDRHCRNLSLDEVNELLSKGVPYVIRQKVPLSGETKFEDLVYGEITIKNSDIEDQILLKADGYPTYNFANVIDDHLMKISHVVRGSEYITSTPKYNLLYEAFGWEKPVYIHLPLIVGKNPDGSTSKLSKRHGATSFQDLLKEGYLAESIINYIALLGWCPKENREIFSLKDLTEVFSADRIVKSPAVFDYDKLNWFNAEYIRMQTLEEFKDLAMPYFKEIFADDNIDFLKLASMIQKRVIKLSQIPDMIRFFKELPEYENDLFINKKSKTNLKNSLLVLKKYKEKLDEISNWQHDDIYNSLVDLAKELEFKNGTVMWPIRIAISGLMVTPGGAVEILEILGKEESLRRINIAISKLDL